MSQNSNIKKFFTGSAVLVLSNVCLKAINFFLLPLYTDNLTPEMLGISDTVTSFTGLLFPILVMGLDSAYSAFYFNEEDIMRKKKVHSSITVLLFGMSAVVLAISIFARPISEFFFGNREYYVIIILAFWSVALNLWFLPFSLELRMQNRMAVYGGITVISSLTMVLLNILFVSGMKLEEYALILSTTIVHGLQVLLFVGATKVKPQIKYVDKELINIMLKFSLPLVPMVVATWILNLSDRYIILWFLGESQVGVYGIGGRFITLVNVVINGITMAYTTFAYANVNNQNAKKEYATVLNIMYVLLAGIAVVISVFAKEIVQLMTSNLYQEAYKPIRDMMFAQVIYGVSTITSYGIYFAKKTKYALVSTTIAAIVNIILNIMFIPHYGITAAAATTLIGYVVMFVINYYYSQKFYPCSYGMKRIVINFMCIYGVTMFIAHMNMYVKIFITILMACLTLLMFKNEIKEAVVVLLKKKG